MRYKCLKFQKKINAPPICLTQVGSLGLCVRVSLKASLVFARRSQTLSKKATRSPSQESGALPKPWRREGAEHGWAADCGPAEPVKAHFHIIVLEKETTCPGVLRAAPRMFPHPTRTRACGQRGRNVRSQVRLGNRKTSCVGGRRGLQIPAGLSHLGVFFPR